MGDSGSWTVISRSDCAPSPSIRAMLAMSGKPRQARNFLRRANRIIQVLDQERARQCQRQADGRRRGDSRRNVGTDRSSRAW